MHQRFDIGHQCQGAVGVGVARADSLGTKWKDSSNMIHLMIICNVGDPLLLDTFLSNWLRLKHCRNHHMFPMEMDLPRQGANNADNDIGDVTDESPVSGIYNPQMDGKVGLQMLCGR